MKKILCCLFLFCTSASAQTKKLTVLTAEWQGFTNKDGTGLYFELLDKTFGKGAYDFKLLPWKRARVEFDEGQGDILLGEDGFRAIHYPKWPIDLNYFSVVYKKGTFTEATADRLKDKNLVWQRGYDVQKTYSTFKKFVEVTDLNQGAKMLESGRVDAIIDFEEDLMNDPTLKPKLASSEFVIEKGTLKAGWIWAAFRGTPEGKALAQKFDQKMDAMKKSGELRRIYEKAQVLPSFDEISAYLKKKK